MSSSSRSLGGVIWQIAVAAFLIAIGIMGLSLKGDLADIIKLGSDIFVYVASVIALLAGVGLVFELMGAQINFLNTLIFIIAVIWAVFIVIMIVKWISDDLPKTWSFLDTLRNLAVYTMVLGSLLGASGKFG